VRYGRGEWLTGTSTGWEKQHFEALQNLYNSVRQDFFSAGSFAPFYWAELKG
jgi:hypothetical protein